MNPIVLEVASLFEEIRCFLSCSLSVLEISARFIAVNNEFAKVS